MHWVVASLVAALFLGLYELSTKHAVQRNAVLPVLFLANLLSAGLWGAALLGQRLDPGLLPAALHVAPLTVGQHAQLALKSLIVASSWCAAYFALKHLPVSIASPIRATAPVWTLLGALVLLGERPTGGEILGIVITLASFVGLSLAGRQEGIHFHRDKWVGWSIVGTLLGAAFLGLIPHAIEATGGTGTPDAIDISSTMLSSLRSSGSVVLESTARPPRDSATALPPLASWATLKVLPKPMMARLPRATPAKSFGFHKEI